MSSYFGKPTTGLYDMGKALYRLGNNAQPSKIPDYVTRWIYNTSNINLSDFSFTRAVVSFTNESSSAEIILVLVDELMEEVNYAMVDYTIPITGKVDEYAKVILIDMDLFIEGPRSEVYVMMYKMYYILCDMYITQHTSGPAIKLATSRVTNAIYYSTLVISEMFDSPFIGSSDVKSFADLMSKLFYKEMLKTISIDSTLAQKMKASDFLKNKEQMSNAMVYLLNKFVENNSVDFIYGGLLKDAIIESIEKIVE